MIGIELSEDAINDARFNAQHNRLENVEFFSGRAESLIPTVLACMESDVDNVVAIIDPPRCGLGKFPFPSTIKTNHSYTASSLIKAIRNNRKINRVVYVSCEAQAAQQNFLE